MPRAVLFRTKSVNVPPISTASFALPDIAFPALMLVWILITVMVSPNRSMNRGSNTPGVKGEANKRYIAW